MSFSICSARPLVRIAGSAVLDGSKSVASVSWSGMQDGYSVGSSYIEMSGLGSRHIPILLVHRFASSRGDESKELSDGFAEM